MDFNQNYSHIVTKLQKQQNPKILFSDIDGTVFSPNLNLLTAPIFNVQTAAYLKTENIPFIIVTGRSFWRRIDQYHISLLGLPKADAVVTANGSAIYYLEKERYVSDFIWQGLMQSTKVTHANGQSSTWNKQEITETIANYLLGSHRIFRFGQGNTYLIRVRLDKYPVEKIKHMQKEILGLFPKGIRIVPTEKLLWKNTLEIFSGELLVTPATAGKDKAVQYLLRKFTTEANGIWHMGYGLEKEQEPSTGSGKNFSLSEQSESKGKILHAYIFGDATVDIPMLTMKQDENSYTLSQYAIHPTPLAKAVLQEKIITNPNIHILEGDGPKEILQVLTGKQTVSSHSANRLPTTAVDSSPDAVSGTLSIAQNNKARNVIRKFEWVLDRIVDKNMSANEISFLGLQKLSEGIQQLQKPNASVVEKTKGIYKYGFGNLTDILDGIRARSLHPRGVNKTGATLTSGVRDLTVNGNGIPGQLVDGFSDRAKEFMQLYIRAVKRLHSLISLSSLGEGRGEVGTQQFKNKTIEQSVSTFLAAISCCLPSIARAQVEISGTTVSERDEKGGSMIDRTRRLFLSLLFDMLGLDDQSEAKDKEIFDTNLATFQHRLSSLRLPTSGGSRSKQSNSSSSESEGRIEKHVNSSRLTLFARTIKLDDMNDFQKKALERFLLYVDVLQQENKIIEKYLAKYPEHFKDYKKESTKLAKDYLALPVQKLRKKFGIKDYKLEVKKYI